MTVTDKGKKCVCHGVCLKPGNARLTECKGEHPSGCWNCSCFGLMTPEDWEKLARERKLPELPRGFWGA